MRAGFAALDRLGDRELFELFGWLAEVKTGRPSAGRVPARQTWQGFKTHLRGLL
jgi:hypothetical protein